MRKPLKLDAVRRRDLRKVKEVRRGMPSMLPENPSHLEASTMRPGDQVQATIDFDESRIVTAEEATVQFSGEVAEDESGTIVVLSRCSITTPAGAPFEDDAVVHIGGSLARDLAARKSCLSGRAFRLHGRLTLRSDGRGSYDLTAFSGTSPRGTASY